MISTHLYFYKHALSDMGIYLSKEKKTKIYKFKTTYLSNYLNKMEQIIKKFENSIIKKKK
jgi:hypothetical protein